MSVAVAPAHPWDLVRAECLCPCACHERDPWLDLATLRIDPARLTPTERALVAALLPPGRVASHAALHHAAWPGASPETTRRVLKRRVRVNVSRARFKLEAAGWDLESVVGAGYRLARRRGGRGERA